jgi:hypothetical protein
VPVSSRRIKFWSELTDMGRYVSWLPAILAALTNLLIGYAIATNQPYPRAAIIAQSVMQLAALLAVAPSRVVAVVSVILFLGGMAAMVSFWFYWVPTLVAYAAVLSRRADPAL